MGIVSRTPRLAEIVALVLANLAFVEGIPNSLAFAGKMEDFELNTPAKKPNPIDIEVGSRIRLQRKVLGLTQTSLADALGITFQQVQKYEKGANRVGASRLQAMADVLKVPVSYFFGTDQTVESSPSREGNEVISFLNSAEGLALNRAFSRVESADIRRRLVGLVKALADEDA